MTVSMPPVLELWRWPVKGMGGERMPSLRLDARGVGGDRSHAVLRLQDDGTWTALSERQQPRLAAWTAAYPFNIGANVDPVSPPLALATSRRTHVRVERPAAAARARGRPRPPRPPAPRHRRPPARRAHRPRLLGRRADPRALRSNVHLAGGDELGEPGLTLEFAGAVRLRVLRACPRGGVYARVTGSGRLAADVDLH